MNLLTIKLSEIVANPNQPRKHFDEQALQELSESIRSDGLMSPITIRPLNGKHEIVQGERRYRASKLAGLSEIQAFVQEMSDEDAFHLSVIENIQREQMTPIEEANAFMRYVEMGFTHAQIAEKVSKDRTFVTSRLRMLQLVPELQDWIAERRISHGHVTQLLKYDAILSKHIGRAESSKAVQSLFHQYFENKHKISVIDVKDWGESMRWHFLVAIVGMYNDKGNLKVWNKYRSIKSFCGDFHLHIKTVTREDIQFLTDWKIEHADKGVKKSTIYEMYEKLEEHLFDRGIDTSSIWDSREVYYIGEKTLEQLTDSIRGHLKEMEGARQKLIASYRKAAGQSSGDAERQLLEKADKCERMDIHDFISDYLDSEKVSCDTIG